jgi:hypothetical protein
VLGAVSNLQCNKQSDVLLAPLMPELGHSVPVLQRLARTHQFISASEQARVPEGLSERLEHTILLNAGQGMVIPLLGCSHLCFAHRTASIVLAANL